MTIRRGSTVAVLAATLAGCSRDEARLQELERRLATVQRQLERQSETNRSLEEALRQAGIPFRVMPPADATEELAHEIEALELQARRLDKAVASRDTAAGQQAMQAIGALLEELESRREVALPLLLAAAERSEGTPQSSLLEAYARLGGVEVLPELGRILDDRGAAPRLRFQAARSLVELDADAAAPRVSRLLEGEPDFPELYFLVFQLGESRAPSALPVLCAALAESADPSVRCHAATALGNFPGETAAAALSAAATADSYPAVRVNALRALPKAAPGKAAEVAREVLGGAPEPQVRDAAQQVLDAGGKGGTR